MRLISSIIMVLLFSSPAMAFEKTEHFSLDAGGISVLEVECGAGFLVINGDSETGRIEVEAEIILDHIRENDVEKILKHKVKLSLDKRGNKAILKSHINNDSFSFFGRNGSSQINLTIRVPKIMNIEVEDGSGNIEITGITGAVDIDDGSGSMEISDIDGSLTIEDGSGNMEIRRVSGKTDIHDGSGGIRVREVTGDVVIRDGSGSIEVFEADGEVDIKDGSGELSVENVRGDVVIHDGSGSIYVNDVEQNVVIEEAGSGSVKIHGVKGNVERYD